jgi:integration host factor subunit beta
MHSRATAAVVRATTQEAQVKTVTKKELVHRIAEQTGVTKVVAKDVIQAFLNSIIDELSEGNRLEFREFGVFESRERAARLAQNPRTLEKVPVPAKRIVKFKVGRLMRKKVSGEDVGDLSLDDDDVSAKAVAAPSPPVSNDGEAHGMA